MNNRIIEFRGLAQNIQTGEKKMFYYGIGGLTLMGYFWIEKDMQFTGLLDCTGQKIWEGDRVKMIRSVRVGTRRVKNGRSYSSYSIDKQMELRGIVRIGLFKHYFSQAMLVYVEVDQNTEYPSYFWGEGKASDKPVNHKENLSEVMDTKNKYEVIGNVFEENK